MKNKQKLWRRMARKSINESGDKVRNGRMLRKLTIGYNINPVRTTSILSAMFSRAGIVTQVPTKHEQQSGEFVNETK